MHPNDAALAKVYAREVGSTVSDQSFSVAKDFEIVVEAEAGSTIFDDGGKYRLDVILFDKKAIQNIEVKPEAPPQTTDFDGDGNMTDANWDTQAETFVYLVSKDALTGRDGHTCDLSASLQVGGGTEPNVSDALGPIIHLHA